MASQHKSSLTPDQYLAGERLADHKSEYFNGEVFAMAGATEAHITIVSNLTYLFVGQFKGRPCKAYSNEMKVLVRATASLLILTSRLFAGSLFSTISIGMSC